jgi:hypothetical protein
MTKTVRLLVLLFTIVLVFSACNSTKSPVEEILPVEPQVTDEPQTRAEPQIVVMPQVPDELQTVEEPQVMVAVEPGVPDAMPSGDEEVFLPLKIEPPDERVALEAASDEVPPAEIQNTNTPQPEPQPSVPQLEPPISAELELALPQDLPTPEESETLPVLPETVLPPFVDVSPVTIPSPAVPSDPQPMEPPQEPTEIAVTESPAPEFGESEFAESESDDIEPLAPLSPVPSRTASIDVNQYLDIPYHGAGWVYLGELKYPGLVSYIDRKRIGSDTVFTIQADKPGQTTLQFYREDILTRAEVNDYFELTIAAPQAFLSNETSSVAPRTSVQVEPTPQAELQAPEPLQEIAAITESAPAMSSLSPPPLSANRGLYDKAETAFQAANYQEAAVFIGQSLELSTDDKGLFLKGQIYEAKSPVRDLRLALNAYQQLADTFPMSLLRPDALKRITYLKRFYFTIN